MPQAVIYTRFSPRPNAAECESCATQRAYCEEIAHKLKLDIRSTFDDEDRSGKDEYREKLWAAIESLRKGDRLLVWKADRLARNVYLAEQIHRAVQAKGAEIVSYNHDIGDPHDPNSVLIRQVLEAVAEYERKLIGIRTSQAMKMHQKQGRIMGRIPPYGWQRDPADPARLIPCKAEQEMLAEMKAQKTSGKNCEQIAKWLNANPKSNPRNVRWNRRTVRKTLIRHEND